MAWPDLKWTNPHGVDTSTDACPAGPGQAAGTAHPRRRHRGL